MKKVKLHITVEVQVPANAEVIRFTDEEGVTTDHIKMSGRLLRPDIMWMEYTPSKIPLNQKKWHPDMCIGWESGTPLCDKLTEQTGFPEWYLEEHRKV